jgi:hypothetical protein
MIINLQLITDQYYTTFSVNDLGGKCAQRETFAITGDLRRTAMNTTSISPWAILDCVSVDSRLAP